MGIEIIPDELLEHIWSFVDDDLSGPETAHILAAVSQRWRQAALNAGHLWTKLFVAQEHGELSSDLKLRLQRRQAAPLTIRFLRTSPEALQELGKTIAEWRNLWISVECYEQVLNFLATMRREQVEQLQGNGVSTPMLREATIALTLTRSDIDAQRFPSDLDERIWPQLKIFNITCHSISSWLTIIPSTITEFSLISARLTGKEIQTLSRKCPNLIRLYLSINVVQFPERDYEQFHLPHLKEVVFGEAGVVAFLLALSESAPKLRSFILRPRSINSSFVYRGRAANLRPTRFTRLEFDMKYRLSGPHFPGEVSLLLSICPRLEVLVLKGARRAKEASNSDVINEIQNRIIENARKLVGEVVNCLALGSTASGNRVCPVLREVHVHHLPMETDYITRLAGRPAINETIPSSPSLRLGLYGCTGITLEDCQAVRGDIVIDFV